jgi:dCMP deaminase
MENNIKTKYKKLSKKLLSAYEEMSTCSRMKVAALMFNDLRVVASGFNGTPRGLIHCSDIFKNVNGEYFIIKDKWFDREFFKFKENRGNINLNRNYFKTLESEHNFEELYELISEKDYREIHHKFSNKYEVHAEVNMIGTMLKNDTSINENIVICSYSPCQDCAKLLSSVGINKIYYIKEYDRNQDDLDYFKNFGLEIEKI